MIVLRTPDEMRQWSREQHGAGLSVGFVPTMGYLHQGHLALVSHAHQQADQVVVSIFVNPLQFGPKEDLKGYPRDLDRDIRLLESVRVEALFLPDQQDMYPSGFATRVQVSGLTEGLCGASRPGHFDGVATVVLKLFNLVQPDVACFGQKDWQQLRVIQQMVEDLNVEVRIVGHPTVREHDGLATSSRNAYLDEEQRATAAAIPRALQKAREQVAGGQRKASSVIDAMRVFFHREAPQIRIDYIQFVHPQTLVPVSDLHGTVLLAMAVYLGRARLIDNALIDVPGRPYVTLPATDLVAVVTQWSGLAGPAICEILASQGFQVIVNGPREDIALSNISGSLTPLPFDVLQEFAVRETAEDVREQFGKVDVLVNNSLLWEDASLAETTDRMWNDMHDANLKSFFYCAKAFGPGMVEAGFGKIVNVTSTSSVNGAHMAYASACAGVLSLTRSLALELAPTVRVNAVACGLLDEPWIDAQGREFRKMLEDKVPLKRLCRAEDVADMVAYLALSGDFLTGQVMLLDGGESRA